MDVPVLVVTRRVPTEWNDAHPAAPFTFTTDGVRHAVEQARAIAGDRTVAVAARTIAGQCLDLGLLDQLAVDLVPVVMGDGRRSFGELPLSDAPLGNPTACIPSDRVIHLTFPVTQ